MLGLSKGLQLVRVQRHGTEGFAVLGQTLHQGSPLDQDRAIKALLNKALGSHRLWSDAQHCQCC